MRIARLFSHIAASAAALAIVNGSAIAQPSGSDTIGVFYFPGWKDNQPGGPAPKPWARFKAFPDRVPLAGEYQEGGKALLTKQLAEMHKAGIKYVAFDLLFQRDGTPLLGTVVDTYLRLTPAERNGVRFSILWANHTKLPESVDQFTAMMRYVAKTYMQDPDYLRIDGKPQLFVNFVWFLTNNARKMGVSVHDLLDAGQKAAASVGVPAVDFVGGTDSPLPDLTQVKADGYAAISSYGYKRRGPASYVHSFAEMDALYQENWVKLAAGASPMRVIVPMTAGWDRRAWGASDDPLLDQSRSTPEEFQKHLEAGRAFLDSHRALTGGYGVICCWNEFGEGSHIEPTHGDDGAHLAAVQKVFGATR